MRTEIMTKEKSTLRRAAGRLCFLWAVLLGLWACSEQPVASVGREAGSRPMREGIGQAPSFTLPDLDGNQVQFSDYSGKIVILNFWASWCVPCRIEIPQLIDLYNRYRDRGVQVIGIAIDPAGPEALRAFSDELNVNYPMLVGDEKTFYDFGGVVGLPTTFVIDQNGTILSRHMGLVDPSIFEKQILVLLAE
jgi:peroxiredoxin